MSTLAYASLTAKREQAAPDTSTTDQAPGVNTYVDALAALVPAEVLSLHALVLTFTTETVKDTGVTRISAPETLRGAFVALVLLCVVLYVGTKMNAGKWDRLDYARVAIPPLSFVAWTMLQRSTAFDAVWPSLDDATRSVVGVFAAVVLGLAATWLARQADQRQLAPAIDRAPALPVAPA